MNWRSTSPHPVVFVSGPEDYFAGRAIRSLREQLKALDAELEIHEIDAADYQAGQLLNITSPSLFAEPRLVIISGFERCSDELITDGLSYIENPTSDTTVILRHTGSSVRGKKLVDAIRTNSNCAEVACLAIKGDGEKLAFVQGEFQHADRKITQGAAKALRVAVDPMPPPGPRRPRPSTQAAVFSASMHAASAGAGRGFLEGWPARA